MALKPNVERCTESDKGVFRAYIRLILLIKQYKKFQMGFIDTILLKIEEIIFYASVSH